MTVLQQIKQIAQKDIQDIVESLSHQLKRDKSLKFRVDKVEYYCDGDALQSGKSEVECRVRVRLVSGINLLPFIMVYTYDGENIYANKDIQDITAHLVKKYKKYHDISSATAIMAADDDDFFVDDSEGILYEDDDSVSDNIDDLADKVDDLQDAVTEDPEDDVSIEIDNNIVDHYIAECDRCHGIFISAMIESDQKVEKISGKCPLCEKESDQYLKWVVKSASSAGDK